MHLSWCGMYCASRKTTKNKLSFKSEFESCAGSIPAVHMHQGSTAWPQGMRPQQPCPSPRMQSADLPFWPTRILTHANSGMHRQTASTTGVFIVTVDNTSAPSCPLFEDDHESVNYLKASKLSKILETPGVHKGIGLVCMHAVGASSAKTRQDPDQLAIETFLLWYHCTA